MTSLFPRLSSATYHICLLLPFSIISPPLLPFLLGASLPHLTASPLAPFHIFLLSLLLDGHSLATSHSDITLSSRLPPLHFDPRRTSGLLQLSFVSVLPILYLLRGTRPARLHPSDAAAAAAILSLLSLTSAHFLGPFPTPFTSADPTPPATPLLDALLRGLARLFSDLSFRRAGATFELRRALRELVAVRSDLPVDAAGLQRAISAAVYALLGAVDECSQLDGAGWFDAAAAAAGVAAAGWVFTAVVEGEGIGGRVVGLVGMMVAARAARRVVAGKGGQTVLRPLAAVGGKLVWVLVANEFGVVEQVMDAVRVNGESSLLSVVKGVCEVVAAGEGEVAESLFVGAKVVVVMGVAAVWEGGVDTGWGQAGNGRGLGDRLFGAE